MIWNRGFHIVLSVALRTSRFTADSLVGYSPWGHKESDTTEWLSTHSFSSVQFSCSVVSDSLRPHEPEHARPPCPSPTPRVHQNPCLLIWWCRPTTSSSVVPFSSCPQSFPALGSSQMSQLFASGSQIIGGWISLPVQGTLKSLFQHHSSKATILWCSAFFTVQLSHPYMSPEKP